jgi:hypothetical protein
MTKKRLVLPNNDQLNQLLSGYNNTTAGISRVEVEHLSWLGAHLPTGGDYVEIGAHRGKSICCVGCGALHTGNTTARLFAIDLWTLGEKTFDHYRSQETWEIFQRQVKDCGLQDMVKPIMAYSVKASKKRSKPIHLLFIDASHKYKDVLADYEAWSPFVPTAGTIVFHDYKGRFPGVDKVIDEHVIPSGLWADYQRYGRIWSAVRK